MKLFIAIDLEGICGVVSEADTAREGAAAQRARVHMRADLDAVLAGCAAAGADEVVVCDAHDDGRNLDPTGLADSVTLVSGSPTPGSMLEGLAPDCDAALFVGYHGRAGTLGAVLEHTWSYKTYSVSVGDLEVGEFGVAALLAGEMGVPAVYVSGDDKVVAEAAALVPGIIGHGGQAGCPARGRRLRPAGPGPGAHDARRGSGAAGDVPAGAAAVERRTDAPHLHPGAVLRPRRDLPGHDTPGRTHAGDRRRHVRGGVRALPHLPAALGSGGLSGARAAAAGPGRRPRWRAKSWSG